MTEVNHEPGPSTTQSAAAIASSASGRRGRVLGDQRDRVDDPVGRGDLDLAADVGQRVRVAGASPRTSAVMSIGVSAIGSTRPDAPSSRPT